MTEKRCISWTIDDGIGRLAFDCPPSNSMTRFFFLNSNRS